MNPIPLLILGRFRTLDFCFNIRYTEIWNVDTLGIGNYRNGKLEVGGNSPKPHMRWVFPPFPCI